MAGKTTEEVLGEILEVQRDRAAFIQARDAVQQRLNELETNGRAERFQIFLNWAGTQVVMNALILCIIRCDGLIEDYEKLLQNNVVFH